MSKRPLFALLVPMALLAGCSAPQSALERGWEAGVSIRVADRLGLEYDRTTGEFVETGLKMPGGQSETIDQARESTVSEICERFVCDSNGQESVLTGLLFDSMASLQFENQPSAELQAATERIDRELDEQGMSLDGIDIMDGTSISSRYQEARDARDARAEELWAAEPEAVSAERQIVTQERRAAINDLYSDASFREAQELVVDRCDIEVPDDYVFPTAEELGVHLLRD